MLFQEGSKHQFKPKEVRWQLSLAATSFGVNLHLIFKCLILQCSISGCRFSYALEAILLRDMHNDVLLIRENRVSQDSKIIVHHI